MFPCFHISIDAVGDSLHCYLTVVEIIRLEYFALERVVS